MIDKLFEKKISVFEQACNYKGKDIREEYQNTKPENKQAKKKELQQIFAINAMKLLEEIEYEPIPSYDFDLPHFVSITTPRLKLHDKVQQGKDIFYDVMKIVCDINTKIQTNHTEKPFSYLSDYLSILSKIGSIASSLQYFGIACLVLAWILEEDAGEVMQRYIRKLTRAEKLETDMKILKLALEEIKAKFASVHHILSEITSRQMNVSKHNEVLILSLLQPCEEIEHRFRMKDGIFMQFSFYSIHIMVQFFKLYISLLSILITEFGMDFENKIKSKIEEYPKLLEEYIEDIARKRIKQFITQNYSCDFCAQAQVSRGSWVGRAMVALLFSFGAPVTMPFIPIFAISKAQVKVTSQDLLLKDDKTKAVIVKFCDSDDTLFDEDFRKSLCGESSPFKLYFKEKFSSYMNQLQECISSVK